MARSDEDSRTDEPDRSPAGDRPVTDSETDRYPVHLPWPRRDSDLVTPSLSAAANWSWRFLLVIAAIWVLAKVLGFLATVTVPLAIALLLAALLTPMKNWLVRRRTRPTLATVVVFVGGLTVLIGLISLVIQQFVRGVPMLAEQASGGLDEISDWLESSSLHITEAQLSGWFEQIKSWIGDNSEVVTSGALSTAASAGHILAGFLLALFTLFFLLKDGAIIWQWVLRFVPAQSRGSVNGAAERSWETLGGYVKATALVALVDAVGIGVGLLILQVPLALPLAALVFLTSFIPLIGATLSGAVAVLVALVTVGPFKALIVLGVVIAVQQLESHFLQPVLMGHAVKIHPLGVILAIAAGAITAGIVGALLAVPLAAALNAALSYLYQESPDPEAEIEATIRANSDAATPPDL